VYIDVISYKNGISLDVGVIERSLLHR